MLAPVIPVGRSPYRCCAEAVRQGVITNQVRRSDTPIAPVMNTPCAARAPLTGADLGRHTFMRLQRISRRSIRKDAKRTKGEDRQEAKHGQIFPRPRPITAQRWASSLGPIAHSRFEIGATKGPVRNLRAGQVLSRCCNSRNIVLSRNGAQEAPLGTVSTGWYGTTPDLVF